MSAARLVGFDICGSLCESIVMYGTHKKRKMVRDMAKEYIVLFTLTAELLEFLRNLIH